MAGTQPHIAIKRAYEPPAPEDGTRVLVDRLWPRGVAKATAQIDLWLKEVAPSADLRKWFNHDPARFAEFATRYRQELASGPQHAALEKLRDLARQGHITLLYAAHDTEHNDAVVLRDAIS